MLEVLEAGLYTSIQDAGRTGFRKYGVPVAGAMDAFSARQANLLLNNSPDCAVLECTQVGPKLLFEHASQIVITGADMLPQINQQELTMNKVINVKSSDMLHFGKLQYGTRCYIGVKKGFKSEVILNSRSYYQPITEYAVIQKGQQIEYEVCVDAISQLNSSVAVQHTHFQTTQLPVSAGPEYNLLNPSQVQYLWKTSFHIAINNRMAYQLKEVLPNQISFILTSAVLPGTAQLTPSGKLLILMRDAQTTGGYPRILQLSETAVNILSQKKLGDVVRFKII